MKFLSLFDGCHMFGHALRNVGAECVGTSEIETHPANVTRYHYPDTPQLGDVRNVDATGIEFDCLLAGWSCQGNSVAGKRLGLADERSGLFSEVVRIARQGAPRWILLENVPGMFSVNERKDFGACIGQLGQLGYAVGWRVLDAQHFGVPQRRRRVFFVGCLGDPRSAAEVLFEPESVRGDSPPSREAGQGVPWETGSGPSGWPSAIAPTLDASGIKQSNQDVFSNKMAAYVPSTSKCLTDHGQRLDFETETFVVDLAQVTSKTNRSKATPGPSPTLCAGSQAAAFNWRQSQSMPHRLAPTLDACGSGSVSVMGHISHTLTAEKHGASEDGTGRGTPIISTGPRRLMPVECERLQGLPDDWTRYGRKPSGEVYELKDSPRYKMIGNGGAVPVVEWLGSRMVAL